MPSTTKPKAKKTTAAKTQKSAAKPDKQDTKATDAEVATEPKAFTFNVALPPELVSQIHQESDALGLTAAQFVAALLRLYQTKNT